MTELTQPSKAETTAGNRSAVQFSVAFAMLAALSYILTAVGVLSPGLEETPPAAIPFFAAACYFVGGLLILLRNRKLWITGLIINTLIIAMFVSAYRSRPEVLFSPAGISTKSAQLMLEFSLLYLVLAGRKKTRGNNP
jgi:hypothetical protein